MWKNQERRKITKMLSANYLVVNPPQSKRLMSKRITEKSQGDNDSVSMNVQKIKKMDTGSMMNKSVAIKNSN